MAIVTIPIPQPFDLVATLATGQGHRWLKEWGNDGWYQGVIGNDVVRIRQFGNVDVTNNVVEFDSPWTQQQVIDFLTWHFRLDDDIYGIYNCLIKRDSVMADLVPRYCGLRVMRVDPWECLVFFILSPIKPIQGIQGNMEQIAAAFSGQPIGYGATRYPFPRPSTILQHPWGLDILNALGFGLDKGTKVYKAAKAVDSGALDLDALAKAMSLQQVLTALQILNGVGPKVANCAALFSLEKLNAFPVDGNVGKAVQWHYYNHPKNPTAISNYGRNKFGPCAGYAEVFLFYDGYVNPGRDPNGPNPNRQPW